MNIKLMNKIAKVGTAVFDNVGFAVGISRVVAQLAKQRGVPIVGVLYLIFFACMTIDNEIFVFFIFAANLDIRAA